MIAVASVVFAGTPAIGIVTASGHFTLERSQVWGNSTLFDGATVETDSASSELALSNGVRMQLGAASRARVWETRMLLEKGVGQMAGPTSYEIDAGGLKIRVGSPNARVRVSLTGRVEVTALSGAARVASGSGILLAAIPAGHSMIFSMQAAPTGAITRTGCLLYKDGHFIMQDDNTQEVVELNGTGIAANTGNRVEVTGTATGAKPAVTIATLQMNVTSLTVQSQGGCLTVAAALDASTAAPPSGTPAAVQPIPASTPPATTGGGMSTGAKVGIGAAIAGGGAAAAILLAQKKKSTSP